MNSIEERAAEIAKAPWAYASAEVTACLIELMKHAKSQKAAIEAEVAKVAALRVAGNQLSFHAQTTGGVAGRDRALQVTISDWVEAVSKIGKPAKAPDCLLCDDCPPDGYPTDKTRCASCPRRAAKGAKP